MQGEKEGEFFFSFFATLTDMATLVVGSGMVGFGPLVKHN
jgi:hypothetical protein